MPDAPLAQRLLALATSYPQASAIVGDALEQAESPFGFWLTIARVFFSLTWRWIAGFLASPVVIVCVFLGPYALPFLKPDHATLILWTENPLWHLLQPTELYLHVFAAVLSCTTVLAIARFGIRDRLSLLSVALTALITAANCVIFRVNPTLGAPVILLLFATLTLPFFCKVTRIAAVRVVSTVTAQFILFFIWGLLCNSLLSRFAWFHRLLPDQHDIVVFACMVPPILLGGSYFLGKTQQWSTRYLTR